MNVSLKLALRALGKEKIRIGFVSRPRVHRFAPRCHFNTLNRFERGARATPDERKPYSDKLRAWIAARQS